MPRRAYIFEVVIASPSDVPDERRIVQEAIREWNIQNSMTSGILIEPVMWETHVHPDMGERPQGIINEQVLMHADAVIGVFWSRIGTPSGTHRSGSVEEVQYFIDAGKPTMVYFSRRSLPIDVDVEQLAGVRDFEKECSERGIIGTYSSLEEFDQLVRAHICQLANRLRAEAGPTADSSYARKKRRAASLYKFETDQERLRIQADILLGLDSRAIAKALDFLRPDGSTSPLRILDVGCADGYVTHTRFCSLPDVSITGIDISKKAIVAALEQRAAAHAEFRVEDATSLNPDAHRFDLIFCALSLHHMENPEGVMHRLWSMLDDPGVLMVRGSDDGLKVNYPENEDLEFLLATTNTIRGSSDRHNGRKIYTHMKRLLPEPCRIDMDFQVDSTAGMDAASRLAFFDDNYSFRANYAISLAESDAATEADVDLATRLTRIVREQRQRFERDESVFSVTVQNIATAYKQPS